MSASAASASEPAALEMGADTIFGHAPAGEPVRRLTISAGGLTANILSWGAVIQDLRLEGHEAPLTLGFERLDDYLEHPNYFGAVVGRHANRIRDGRFTVAGDEYRIEPERPQAHGLHGGSGGYGRRNWAVAGFGADFVSLSLTDPDGIMGFPGSLDVQCVYRLREPGIFSVELTATTDQPTLCNLAQHAYFNLDDGGATDTLSHELTIAADAYLPVDAELIPTGEVLPVAGTVYDFRRPRKIRPAEVEASVRYDNNFCLAAARGALRRAAWARAARSGVEMEVWTTEPGIQFYGGQYVGNQPAGLGGREYGPFSGFCLEAQTWPDSPNRPYFPQALLRPDEIYRQITEFRFRRG
jgi:aldose 1-epimerase